MRLHRFIGNFDLNKKEVKITNPENIKQIKGVLRLEEGDKLILCDGKGIETEVVISFLSHNEIICKIEKRIETKEPKRKVYLYLAILKKENFEIAVQKSVECGVSCIIPTITERTVKTGLNTERIEKIIREASEQSGRSVVPELLDTMNFQNALEHGKNKNEKVIFHLVDTEYRPDKNAKEIAIFVGPEGGFSEKEITLAKEYDYTVASLGSLTLRGETAGIIATYRAVQGI
ncbi:16S rRNA (uracil(1498)-N(3))-methyltransferase [Candidatus Nomurabacteria bacterium]|nr:16S rRNA (uracil(1498)-N(3))-methyltransferase [Candidatus Nomurabacteria bacterium]